MGLSKRVRAAIAIMIEEGAARLEAANRVGLADNSLRQAFANPQVLAFWNSELCALRNSERVRSLRALIDIRDDPALRGSPAGQKVRAEAARSLDGLGQENHSVQVNLAVHNEVRPQAAGYVIAIDPRFINLPEVQAYMARHPELET